MSNVFANQFRDIPSTLQIREDLRSSALALIGTQPILGKALDGPGRVDTFRAVLKQLVLGAITPEQAYESTETLLPRNDSPYSHDNRVFASGWGERLVRSQYSRFYNQAAIEHLIAQKHTHGFVPHSVDEDRTSQCSVGMAGRMHLLTTLRQRLLDAYEKGNHSEDLKIPHHPHCTHVVILIESRNSDDR